MALEQHQIDKLYSLMEILRNIDVGLVVIDKELKIQFWNDFMENHSGSASAEVKHQVITDLFTDVPNDWFRKKLIQFFCYRIKPS
ncbi:PAS domain-containing protein [Aliamphritea spongicola]|nr:PAS domain-containing protein [Aliamphritea spongicola]